MRVQIPAATLCALAGIAQAAVNPIPTVSVDMRVRSSVRIFDSTVYPASNGQTVGWAVGSNCTIGTENQDFIDATVLRVNYYRRLVGLPDVIEDPTASAKAIQAALIMHKNNRLSHEPELDWICYTPEGRQAAERSNLALGANGPTAIDLYINDPGAGNEQAGHRRWIFFPPLTAVGVGDTTNANALWVSEITAHPNIWGARPSTPRWVAWPYAGFFPISRHPSSNRWSYSRYGASFQPAPNQLSTVRVTDDSGAILNSAVTHGGNGATNSFPDSSLVWTMTGVNTSAPASNGVRAYHVLIRRMRIGGVEHSTHYTTLLHDATVSVADQAARTASVNTTYPTAVEGGVIPGTFTVTLNDAATADTWINYTLSGPATDADFNLSGAIKIAAGQTSGQLQISAINDFTTEGTETVTITLDPGAGYQVGSATSSVDIVDQGPNTAPAFAAALSDMTVTSVGGVTSPASQTFSVLDNQIADVLTVTVVNSSNTTLLPLSAISVIDNGSGSWSVTVNPVDGLTGSSLVTLQVTDSNGLSSQSSFVVTVPNTAPTISAIANTTVNVGSSGGTTGTINFTVDDAETGAGAVTVTATASNSSLAPAQNITLGGSGTNRSIAVEIADQITGTVTITVRATDSAGQFSTETFVITVPNTAPSFASTVADQSIAKNGTSGPLNFTLADVQSPSFLVVSASSSNQTLFPTSAITLGGSGLSRTLTLTPAVGLAGTATITLTVTDRGGLSATDTIAVTVTNTGDTTPPSTPAAPTATNGTTNTPTFSGNTEAAALVRIYDNGVQIGTATADIISGNWSWTATSGLSMGLHSITVRAQDANGNLSDLSPATNITISQQGTAGLNLQTAATGSCGQGLFSGLLILGFGLLGLRRRRR